MIITILSIIFAALLIYFQNFFDFTNPFIAFIIALGGIFPILVFSWIHGNAFLPIQKLEQKFLPGLMEKFQNDIFWKISRFVLPLFFFFSFLIPVAFLSRDFPDKVLVFAAWIVALGICLDLVKDSFKRVTTFLNPFDQVQGLNHDAIKAIQEGDDKVLWEKLDALAEGSIHSVERSKIALANKCINLFPTILKTFFDSKKSISSVSKDVAEKPGYDEASYIVFYILQRLEQINSKALENHLGSICSQLITVLGKIVVVCARFDLSLVSFPVHVLGKFALKAQQHHYDEAAALAASTLLEVAKTIINEIDLTYAELVEPFNTITNNLDAIAQATFKKDKNIPIKLITESLRDLKAIYQSDKISSHRDTPVILKYVEAKLAEFDALEQVMRSIPPITLT